MKKAVLIIAILSLAACDNGGKTEQKIDTLSKQAETLLNKTVDTLSVKAEKVWDSAKVKGGVLFDSATSKGGKFLHKAKGEFNKLTKKDSTK